MCYIDMVKGETESLEYQYPGSCILSSTGDARGFLFVIEGATTWGFIHLVGLGTFWRPFQSILLQGQFAEMLLESP